MINRKYWMFLGCSILLEVFGTCVMKYSQLEETLLPPAAGMSIMYASLAGSYFLLAKAIMRLPIGVAYAFWEASGLLFIASTSVLLLGESLGWQKLAALGLVLLGAFMVHHGTSAGHGQERREPLTGGV